MTEYKIPTIKEIREQNERNRRDNNNWSGIHRARHGPRQWPRKLFHALGWAAAGAMIGWGLCRGF